VTIADTHHAGGRILVYCPKCREEGRHHLDISIPLQLVDGALFVSLYRHGFTASNPEMAAEIVFGARPPAGVIAEATRLLAEG
jgi:hypothetical protein